ncbi:myb-binding protein 1A-like protein isoform X2 [Acanthaster planci]|uniref:Myb-binding protein 1A-like protein isoform X2 n=1 Tax=Acanthaster planci TaxID=133434 RepID=A0A8B7ZK97_ACAPL|nr:myb-binding protein 1A-like protein isoform X2 [Acanthaster planci]
MAAAEKLHVDAKVVESKFQKHPERQSKQDKQLLETFWDLAATLDGKRVGAAGRLIDIVSRRQADHQRDGTASMTATPEALCEEVQYTLKRLIRGLASPRKGARQGYAMALAQLLEHIEQITLGDVFKLIKEHLETKGLKSEEKQCLFGKAFAYLSIIQSGKLQKEDGRFSAEVIRQLQNLCVQKGFLEDICFRAVIDLISRSKLVAFEEDIWPTLQRELRQGWGSCNPYTLAMLAACKRTFPSIVDKKFMQKHWEHADLLDASNLPYIARIIANSTTTSHPHPHAVCDILLSWVLEKREKLPIFWNKVVDGHLCTSTQDECVFLAFRLLEAVLPACSTAEIPRVLSKNLLRSFISSLANRQAGLYAAANKLSSSLASLVKNMEDSATQLAIVKGLLLSPGHFNFDEITKSRTVYSIISNFNSDAVRLYLRWLKELFNTGSVNAGSNEPRDVDSGRHWVSMQVLSLVRNPHLQKDTDWLSDCFQFLFLHAFFRVWKATKDIPNCGRVLDVPVGESLRQQMAQHFYSALGVVCNLSTRAPVEPEGTSAESGELWVYVIVTYAQALLNSPDVNRAITFSDEAQGAWAEMLSVVDKLRKKSKLAKSPSAGPAFQLLFLHVGLQMFSETQQAVDILQDLHGCYERAVSRRRSLKKKTEDEPEWVEVVTEILLSLLSKPSHLLRTVVDGVFKMICPHMTPEALQLLLDILDPTKEVEDGNMEITESDYEEDAEMEEGSDDDDDDDDGEEQEKNDKVMESTPVSKKKRLSNGHGNHTNKKPSSEDSHNESENSEDSESGDENNEDDEDDDVDEFFRNDVKTALGDAAADEDDSDDDDVASNFDDDTMMRLDTALSSLFKAKMADRRKGKKETNTVLLHFKLRVLDLLDIFIKRQQSNPLILELVLPLLVVAQTASVHKDQHVLSEKAVSIFHNKLCRVRKYPHNLTEQRELLHDTIEAILQIAKKATSVMTVSLSSTGCLFLIRVLRGNVEMTDLSPVKTRHQRAEEKKASSVTQENVPQSNMLDVERISKLYCSALEDFMTHRSTNLHSLLFSELIERFPNLAWHFAEDLVQYISTGCQLYRKTQACRLLALLMSSRPVQGDSGRWSNTSERLLKDGLEVLQSMLDGEQVIKPKFLLQLLILLREFANACHCVNKLPNFSKMESRLEELQKKVEVSRSGELTSAVRSVLKAFSNRPADTRGSGKRNKRKKHKRNKKSKRSKPVDS